MTNWWGDFPNLRSELRDLFVLSHAESTNDKARELVAADYLGVITHNQTAGRGRLGRPWESLPGHGVALSIITPSLDLKLRSWLPILAGSAVAHELIARGVEGAQVKWPNDVLIREGKVSGILCEALPSGRIVVGIGLNVQFESERRPTPDARAVSDEIPVSHQVIDEFLGSVVRTIKTYCGMPTGDLRDSLQTFATSLMGTLGRTVKVQDVDGLEWRGLARSLTEEGHLLVENSVTGELRTVVASDVTHLRQ